MESSFEPPPVLHTGPAPPVHIEPSINRLQLGPRLLWPLALSSAVLLALGISGAWYVLQLQRSASEILDWNVSSIRAAEELEIGVRELRSLLREFQLRSDRKPLDQIPQQLAVVSEWLHESARLATSDRERELMETALRGYAELELACAKLAHTEAPVALQELVREMTDQIIPQQILPQANEYLSVNENSLLENSHENQVLAQRLSLALLLIGISGASGSLLAGYILARMVKRSFVQLNVPIHDVTGQLQDIVGPVPVPDVADFQDLELILKQVSGQVAEVVQRLRQRETQALRAEQMAALGQMVAGLAHELRNPLMSMKILVQSALSQAAGQLDGADLDVLDDEISRLEHLVQTFLDYARPANPTLRTFNLVDHVRQTVDLVRRQADVRGITLAVNTTSEEITLSADAAQIRQVLLNLLVNALDAMSSKGEITVRLRNVAAAAEPHVVLQVQDQGTGLPQADYEGLFEPFVSTKSTGIGLGLAICRRIVEAHGGTIVARPGEMVGAVFEVQLPNPVNSPSGGTLDTTNSNRADH